MQDVTNQRTRSFTHLELAMLLTAVALIGSGLLHLGILVVSGDSWTGPLSWRKAATFGISFGLTLLAVTVCGRAMRATRLWPVLLAAFGAACVVETVLVSMQVWRGRPSHFNFETPFDTAVAMTLAAGGAVLVLCGLGFTVIALTSTGSRPMVLALRAGFVTLVAGFVVGAVMVAKGATLARGGSPELAYDTAGRLKPLHAVLLHGVLVLPPVAWIAARSDLRAGTALWVTRAAVAAYALAVAAVSWSLA